MKCFTRLFLSFGLLAVSMGCQGYKPDFAYGPQPSPGQEHVIVLATAPAVYQEIGPIKVKHDRALSLSSRRQWESALANAKSKASEMGANAIVVPKLGHYHNSATAEAYTGMEGLYSPGTSEQWLDVDKQLMVLAIRIP